MVLSLVGLTQMSSPEDGLLVRLIHWAGLFLAGHASQPSTQFRADLENSSLAYPSVNSWGKSLIQLDYCVLHNYLLISSFESIY